MGRNIVVRLERMQAALPCIGEIRGLGAMCAVELVSDPAARTPAPELARRTVQCALGNGLVVLSCGLYGNVLRVLVPLTASDQIVDEGLDILERSLTEAVQA
jgi:4-aminobutyrate aminotransferase